MQALVRHNRSLPYSLKRPYYTFFAIFTVVVVVALVVAAFAGGFELALLILGPSWFGLSFGVIGNWQSLTLFEDRLIFNSFGKKNVVLYKDIGEAAVVDAVVGNDYIPTLTLYLHHQGAGKTPLKINLKLFAAKDRTFLLEVIKESAPNGHLNELAQAMSGSSQNRA